MMTASLLSDPQTGVRRFLTWWSNELSDTAGGSSRRRPWRVMFLRKQGACEVYLRTGDRIEPIGTAGTGDDGPLAELRRRVGRHKLAPDQIVLRLQPSEVVQTHLSVPAAAGDVLEPILRNQIERLAPWPIDKALYAYEIAPAAGGSTTLDVTLTVTGRSLVGGLIAELERFGFAPGVADCGADAAHEPRVNLLVTRADTGRRSGRLVLTTVGLLCLVALVAGAVGAVGMVRQTRQLAAIQARLQEVQAQSAAELPSQATVRRQARLTAEKISTPSVAVMVEALSRALPDDAWLNRLEVEQGVVRLTGNAGNAAALIGRIETSGHFTDVQFAAPTTLGEGDTEESFTITGKIVAGRGLN